MHEPYTKIGFADPELKNSFIHYVINFVFDQLDAWRDSKRDLHTSECKLNEQLCIYLSNKSRHEGLFTFHHEQSQPNQRRVDISAKPLDAFINVKIYDSIYDNITVFEAKRLPSPRPDEYVTGYKKLTGGIQRFRLCLHGSNHNIAALIGYIQKDNLEIIYDSINNLVTKISETPDGLKWDINDTLSELNVNKKSRKAQTTSTHSRSDGTKIQLHHLWIEMKHSAFD